MSYTIEPELSVADLFKGDLQFASTPNIYFEIQSIIGDPNKSTTDAAFIIEKDASLSIRILKIVNSAFYGFPAKIISISHAVSIIGSRELQTLTLATIVMDKFSGLPKELVSMHDFWATNLRCALIAQEIDRYLDSKFTDSIFICGILHNIGQLLFYRRIPELAKQVLLTLQAEDRAVGDEIMIERDIVGFDHYEAGAALTSLWKLPEIITQSISLHPYPNNESEFSIIASIIRAADSYSKLEKYNEDMKNNLGIPTEDMAKIIDSAFDQFEYVFKVFYHN